MNLWKLVTVALVFVLFSCSGGGSDSSNNAPNAPLELETGTFIDGLVVGLAYKTESNAGLTDAKGGFTYKEGEEIVFSIGDITLGAGIAKPIMTPLEIIGEGNDQNSSVFINVIRLLQTLDYDNNPQNGIQIPEQAHMFAMGISLPLDEAVEQFENNQTLLSYILDAAGKNGLISRVDAIAHWEDTYYGSMFFNVTTDDPAIPLVLMAYDGSKMAPTYDGAGLHTGAVIITPNGDEAVLELNNDGTPKSLVIDKTYISFSGYTEETVDIGIIYEDGSIEVFPSLMNFYSNIVKPDTVAQKASLYLSRTSFASNVNVDPVNTNLKSADMLFSVMVTNAVKEQLTNLYKNGVLLKGSKVNTKLNKALKTAVIKELTLQLSSQLPGVDIAYLRAGGEVATIVINAVQCSSLQVDKCMSAIVTSTKNTVEAATLVYKIFEQEGIKQKMVNDLADKKLLFGPTMQATVNVVALVENGQNLMYKVKIDTEGSKSYVDDSRVTAYTVMIKSPLRETFTPISFNSFYLHEVTSGLHEFKITGTDEFGLSSTITTSITIPDRPTVPVETIKELDSSVQFSSRLDGSSTLPLTFRIIDEPEHASNPKLNLKERTGEFMYTGKGIFISDSFTYVAEHMLPESDCRPISDSFKCKVPSKISTFTISPTEFIYNYSITETVTAFDASPADGGGGQNCNDPDSVGSVRTYDETWAYHVNDCIGSGACQSNITGLAGYFFYPLNGSIKLLEEKPTQLDFIGGDGESRYYQFTGTLNGSVDLDTGFVTGVSQAEQFSTWTGDNTTQTCTKTSSFYAEPI